MKNKRALALLFMTCFLLYGCGKTMYPEMPSEYIIFEMGEYVDSDDQDALYGTIEYNGRTYLPYGTLKNSIQEKDIEKCLGYVVQDSDEADHNVRLYTLKEDLNHNFLLEHYASNKAEMMQPYFWRATDTKGQDIDIPDYIDSLEYAFWKD